MHGLIDKNAERHPAVFIDRMPGSADCGYVFGNATAVLAHIGDLPEHKMGLIGQ